MIRQLAVLLVLSLITQRCLPSTSRVFLPFYKLLSLQSSAELIRYSISAIFCEMAVTTPSWAWCIQTAKPDKFLIHWLAIGGLKSRKHRHR